VVATAAVAAASLDYARKHRMVGRFDEATSAYRAQLSRLACRLRPDEPSYWIAMSNDNPFGAEHVAAFEKGDLGHWSPITQGHASCACMLHRAGETCVTGHRRRRESPNDAKLKFLTDLKEE
jgi:hypothetical protein